MATPKVAARTATSHFGSIKRYAENDSLDAKFVAGVTKELDGLRGVSLQKYLASEELASEGHTRGRKRTKGEAEAAPFIL
jgi:hypothetical protein